MAYTLMTAEQYVVDRLQNLEAEKGRLRGEIELLKKEVDSANNLIDRFCEKLVLNHSEYIGDYISWNFVTEADDPELFAELKCRMKNKGAD